MNTLELKSKRSRPKTGELNKLFVYGIFLGEGNRNSFGMYAPKYAVVKDYATIPLGGSIVAAVPAHGFDLTGLLVNVDPDFWGDIDRLESSYDRIKINTSRGEAWMYVYPN